MFKEKFSRTKHKSPKFKEHRDEAFGWEDQLEIRQIRKKVNKQHQRRNTIRGKW